MTNKNMILLGVDSPIGLTITRELGKNGISVHGLGWSKRSLGLYSRYLATGNIRKKSEGELINQINQISINYQCKWIMTVSESDILLLNRNKRLLTASLITPYESALSQVLDKNLTLKIAHKIGINIPKTWRISDLSQLDGIKFDLTYPLVLKWDNPHRVTPVLIKLNKNVDKYRYIHNENQLSSYLAEFKDVGEFPLIQEFCGGIGLGQMVLMHEGDAILKFQHHRLAEWPPEGGFSTVCESVSLDLHAELMEKSVTLLRKLNWVGPAMVEYRYNCNTQKAVLMEINGRFWGSLPLAHYARAFFALTYYTSVTENRALPPEPYISGLKCRFMLPEIKRLIRIAFFPNKIQNKLLMPNPFYEIKSFILDFFNLKTRYYVFSLNDPIPFIMDMYYASIESVKRSLTMKLLK